ncbi:MAG: hypothetical protein JXR37_30895, partial [Kiritimatiellae bacterium]|nr:hypothetical protein [Kiritimatiellia bacterium]
MLVYPQNQFRGEPRGFGQTAKTVYPGEYEQATDYTTCGQPWRQRDGLVTNLTAYNAEGQAYQHAVDMDANGEIDTAGTDRITETSSSCTTFSSTNVQQSVTLVYPAASTNTTLEVGRHMRAVDGSGAWSIAYGRTNHTAISRDPATASRTETVTHPDGAQTVSAYTNNMLMAVTRKSSAGATVSTASNSYDGFGRLVSQQETAANGDTRTTTYAYDAAGNLTNGTVSAGAIAQSTAHTFDQMGRRTATTLPDGGEVAYTYAATGELASQSGARTYPVSYTYDGRGRLTTMSTYRDGISGSPDTTTWTYDSQRGWMTAKTYADSTSTSYEYHDNGSLKKRTWARGATAEYTYDGAGSLTETEYVDGGSTNSVSYTLDRLGRATGVTDDAGTHTYTYEDDGQLDTETLPQLGGGHSLDCDYDAFGRRSSAALAVSGTNLFQVSYAYDDAGRLAHVSDGAGNASYAYASDGSAVATITYSNAAAYVMVTTNTFDGLNRLAQIASTPVGASVVSSAYGYDDANLRTTNTLADGSFWLYSYDSLGQVTAAEKRFADGQPVGLSHFAYQFDTIGNREQASLGLTGSRNRGTYGAYTANDVNQYTQRTVPGIISLTGTAATNAVVNVRLTNEVARLANRHGDYFWQTNRVDNSSAAVFSTNLITAYTIDGTNCLVRTETRNVFTPVTPEQFSYDADGNLTADGRFTNIWNAENRLVSMESVAAVPESEKVRLEFTYDHQGRRTEKKVCSSYSGGSYAVTNTYSFAYDGWNLVAEVMDGACTNFYLWGLDLSGSLQGAGGVGGLLAIRDDDLSAERVFPVYDGNGNIVALVQPEPAVSWWSFDNQSDPGNDDVADNDGSVNGATWQSAGQSGGCLCFDGTNDYLGVPDDPSLDLTNEVTVAVWLKTDSTHPTKGYGILTKGDYSVSWNSNYALELGGEGQIFWLSLQSGISLFNISSTTLVTNDEWHFIVGTYDGSVARLYIDGQEENSTDSYSGPLPANNHELAIGTAPGWSDYAGLLDEPAIFPRGLTDEEVQKMYRQGLTNRGILGEYEYGPFGELLKADGGAAKTNAFRFSTK